MKTLTRLVTALVGILTALVVPGTAFASTPPIRPESDTAVQLAAPVAQTPPAPGPAAWTQLSVVTTVAAVLVAVAVVLVAIRVARSRQHTHAPVSA